MLLYHFYKTCEQDVICTYLGTVYETEDENGVEFLAGIVVLPMNEE
jgi:hypothetical protein